MGRKTQLVKKTKKLENVSFNEIKVLENEFKNELETNPKYSLEIDPSNLYNFTPDEKRFIQYMIDFKNLRYVSLGLMQITIEQGLDLYNEYAVQEEIKRINLAMYARRFCSKMADLDSLGGYLTTALTDENVPVADRLSGKEKLVAVRLLMELNQLKAEAYQSPETIDITAIENDIKKLKVDDIKNLIENSEDDEKLLKKKEELINQIDNDGVLSSEELTYLKTLSLDELKKLNKEVQKGKLKNEKTVENKDKQ